MSLTLRIFSKKCIITIIINYFIYFDSIFDSIKGTVRCKG